MSKPGIGRNRFVNYRHALNRDSESFAQVPIANQKELRGFLSGCRNRLSKQRVSGYVHKGLNTGNTGRYDEGPRRGVPGLAVNL